MFKILPQFYCQMCEKFKLLKTRIRYVFSIEIVHRIQFWSQKYTTLNLSHWIVQGKNGRKCGKIGKIHAVEKKIQIFIKHL